MKQRKDIGEVYKDLFSEEEIIPDNNLWELVEFKTEKLKFYKFGLNHFNIYYLSSIVLFSFLSIYSFVEVTSFIKNHSDAKYSSIIPTSLSEERDSNNVSSNSLVPQKNNIKTSPLDKIKLNEKGGNSDEFKTNDAIGTDDSLKEKSDLANSTQSLPSLVKTDSIKIHNKSVPNSQTSVKKEPKRRVVYIEQPDTIIVIDTLKGKEARKKRNK